MGIELANKVMTPLFYVLFVGLAVYLVTLPASGAGYQYIFVLRTPKGLLDPSGVGLCPGAGLLFPCR